MKHDVMLLSAAAFIFLGGFIVQFIARPWSKEALVLFTFYTAPGVIIYFGFAPVHVPLFLLFLLGLVIHVLGRICLIACVWFFGMIGVLGET